MENPIPESIKKLKVNPLRNKKRKKEFKTNFDSYIQFFFFVHVYDLMEWNPLKNAKSSITPFSFWRKVYNYFAIAFAYLNLARYIVLLFITDERWKIRLANTFHITGGNQYINLLILLILVLSLVSMETLFMFYQHFDPVNTAFWLKPLAVMDGRLPPQEIGLDYELGKKLMKRERLASMIFLMTGFGASVFGSSILMVLYFLIYPLDDFIKYGIVGAIDLGLLIIYLTCCLTCLILYLHLICYACYLRFKLINRKIRIIIDKIPQVKFISNKTIDEILILHHEACIVIEKYNQFWKLAIFIIYSSYTPVFVMMSFQSIDIAPDNITFFLSKVGLGGGGVIAFSTVVIFAISTQIIEAEAYSIYPTLCSILASSNRKITRNSRLKLEQLMTQISQRKIGFYCLSLFIIDQKAVYQLCYGVFQFFMLLISLHKDKN